MKADKNDIDRLLKEADYKFLGWQAAPWQTPEYKNCLSLNHNKG